MTKKHFEAFARYIKEQQGLMSEKDLRTFAGIVCMVAEMESNSRFDRARFMAACMLWEQ